MEVSYVMVVPPNGWLISMVKSIYKWIMNRGSPISGNLHLVIYCDCPIFSELKAKHLSQLQRLHRCHIKRRKEHSVSFGWVGGIIPDMHTISGQAWKFVQFVHIYFSCYSSNSSSIDLQYHCSITPKYTDCRWSTFPKSEAQFFQWHGWITFWFDSFKMF